MTTEPTISITLRDEIAAFYGVDQVDIPMSGVAISDRLHLLERCRIMTDGGSTEIGLFYPGASQHLVCLGWVMPSTGEITDVGRAVLAHVEYEVRMAKFGKR